MDGSDPNVFRGLQEASENPFPEQHYDAEADDPVEHLKNQVLLLSEAFDPC